MSKVNIAGLPKGALLAALHNAAGPFVIPGEDTPMRDYQPTHISPSQADVYLGLAVVDGHPDSIAYLRGRKLMIALGGDELETTLYDEANGLGKGSEVVFKLREQLNIPGPGSVWPTEGTAQATTPELLPLAPEENTTPLVPSPIDGLPVAEVWPTEQSDDVPSVADEFQDEVTDGPTNTAANPPFNALGKADDDRR